MEYCIKSATHRIYAALTSALWGAFCIAFLIGAFVAESKDTVLLAIILTPFSFCMLIVFAMAWVNFLISIRKFEIAESGIYIQNAFSKKKLYTWTEIYEIGICKVHYTSIAPYQFDVVIRCALREELNGPRQGYGSWATEMYEMMYYRKIVCIDFSDSMLEAFKQVYPKEVLDYRYIKKDVHDF